MVVIPIAIAEAEQDYYYWAFKYKRVAREWRENTTWGKLFQEYQQRGVLRS
jgi:hypothetical protein